MFERAFNTQRRRSSVISYIPSQIYAPKEIVTSATSLPNATTPKPPLTAGGKNYLI